MKQNVNIWFLRTYLVDKIYELLEVVEMQQSSF